jgi:hypothetical protein
LKPLAGRHESALVGPACPRSQRYRYRDGDRDPDHSPQAGQRAVVSFTILAGAKRHRLEPWAYPRDVLLRLSAGETELKSLLPDRWAARHPEHVLQHRLDESRRRAARQQAVRERRRAKVRIKA